MQRFVLLTTSILLISTTAFFSQWIQTSGPVGGQVTELASEGSDVYSCFLYGGAYHSSDKGINWQPINNGLTDSHVNKISVKGDTLYAIKQLPNNGYLNGIFRSFNKGADWEFISTGFTFTGGIASNGNYVIASTYDGYASSSDACSTWTVHNNFYSPFNIFQKYKDRILLGQDSVLYSTKDGGITLDTLLLKKYLTAIAVENNKICALKPNKLWISEDDGNSWIERTNAFDDQFYNLTICNGNIYVVRYYEGCYRSTDNGQSWNLINSGFINNMYNFITSTQNYIISGGYGTGIMRLQEGDSLWHESNNGIAASWCEDLLVKNNKLYSTTSGGSVHVTSDNGDSWRRLTNGFTSQSQRISSLEQWDNYLFAATYSEGIFRSSDEGETWEHLNSSPANTNRVFYNNEKLFARTGEQLYSSLDYGNTWQLSNIGNGTVISFCKISSDTILAVNHDVYRSTNNGNTWNWLSALPDQVNTMAYNGTYIFAGLLMNGIYRSSDKGYTWEPVNNGLGQYRQLSDFLCYGNYVFASVVDGVYLTTDFGDHWQVINDGFNFPYQLSLAVKDGYLFAGTRSSGVWKRPLASIIPVELTSFTGELINNSIQLKWSTATETNNKGFELERKTDSQWRVITFIKGKGTSTEINKYSYSDDISLKNNTEISYRLKQIDYNGKYEYTKELKFSKSSPLQFELQQNYPNPFNPLTSITYSIPESGIVEITLYDLLGRTVQKLVSEFKETGTYTIKLNASSLPSGVYFYTLSSGEIKLNRKMIIMK